MTWDTTEESAWRRPLPDAPVPPRLRTNSLKRKLREKDCVVGTFVEIPAPPIVELLGLAGFDFAVVDREHGPIDRNECEQLVRAGASSEISVLVRISDHAAATMAQPLDQGAAGIHVPHVTSAEMARCAVHATRYHPLGERGIQPYVRAASYRSYQTAEYLATANDETVLVAQVEGTEGIANLESILGVAGIDVAFVGPYDLSQSLGIPGQVRHARVKGAISAAVGLAKRLGKKIGTYCDDAELANEYRELGVSYLTVSIDAGMFLAGAQALMAKLKV
jgi:4-hydroxy-2-oxoheptanedioate aldolase